jgi:hypothetical protein
MKSMKVLIFIPPKDFRDESISLIKLFFDKWDVEYRITSYTNSECTGAHGAIYRPTVHTGQVNSQDYDGIVLIDGNGIESFKLYDYRPLLDLVTNLNNSKKFIIAVNIAARIPARANIVKDKKISADDKETIRLINLFHGIPSDKDCEIAGNLITLKDGRAIEEEFPKILQQMGVA